MSSAAPAATDAERRLAIAAALQRFVDAGAPILATDEAAAAPAAGSKAGWTSRRERVNYFKAKALWEMCGDVRVPPPQRPAHAAAKAPGPTPWMSRASVEAAADSVDAQRKRDRRAALEREEEAECRREQEEEARADSRRARRRDMEEARRLNDPNDPIAIAAERDRLESIKASVRRSKARDLERELEAAGIVAPSFGEMLGPGSEARLAEYANKKAAYLAAKEASAAPKPAAPPAVAAAAPTYSPWVLRELAKLAPKPPREDQSQAEFEDASARAREMAERGRQRDEERAREDMEARRLVDEANARFAAESRAAAAAAAPAPAPSKWAAWPHGVSADGVPLPPPPPAPPAYVPRQRVDVDLTQSDDEEAIVVK